MTIKKSSFTDDDLAFVQLAPTVVLAAVARGELDLNALARRTLADRGLDRKGKWVGFERAARLLEDVASPERTSPRPTPSSTARDPIRRRRQTHDARSPVRR